MNKIARAMKLLLGVALLFTFSSVANADFDQIFLCHLQQKVDETLLFNDGIIIHPDRASCEAHCRHGDYPMPVPLDNNGHPNRQCARIHEEFGFPECEVNTPAFDGRCSLEACYAACANTE